MKYTDRVYGEFEITAPVILELINSAPLQRLKDIDQAGYRPLWVKPDVETGEYDHSRFAHSVGVYLLLRKYGRPFEEQIAGLIHDVSHSAFSHCIDYVLDNGSEKEQNHQDNLFDGYVRKTEIPKIIKKYDFDLEYILDDKNFPLKEKNLPDLCADRIDHSLKTAVIFGELDNKTKKYLLDNLTTKNNNWVFKDFESAKKYAELFLKLNTDYYTGLASAIMFRTVGDCLRHALQKRYISKDDLYTTDKLVINKIEGFLDKDERLKLLFDRMNNKVKIINDPGNYDASVFCKSRVVDPLFKQGQEIKRVSEVDLGWNDVIKQESEPKQHFLKFEKNMSKVIKLNKSFSIALRPKAPFNFNATVHKPSHFPSSDNLWKKGKYWISMAWKGDVFGVKLEDRGTITKPKIKLSVYSKRPIKKETKDEIIPEIEWRFNLKSDISEFTKRFSKDKVLSPLFKKWKGMKPVAANSFYETLVIYIVLQNATVRRTHQMLENLFDKFGKKVKFNNKMFSTFWDPKAIAKTPEQTLRDLKLGYRAKFLKRISEQFTKGEIDEFKMRKMDRDEVKKKALELYGIGSASVEYLLFEDFYHCDHLATIPPWEQKIMSRLLFDKKLVSTKKILNFFKKNYPNWEKLAFHYIWEDIFWKRKTQRIDWLEKEIRL